MGTKHTPGKWYEAKTGNDQGLVISEQTGANIAVAYDKADAQLIAASPDLLEALENCLWLLESMAKFPEQYPLQDAGESMKRYNVAQDAIQKAIGEK